MTCVKPAFPLALRTRGRTVSAITDNAAAVLVTLKPGMETTTETCRLFSAMRAMMPAEEPLAPGTTTPFVSH